MLRVVRVPPITFTRMFEPRHNILSNVRADIRTYVVSWLKHSRESNRPVPGPIDGKKLMRQEEKQTRKLTADHDLHARTIEENLLDIALVNVTEENFATRMVERKTWNMRKRIGINNNSMMTKFYYKLTVLFIEVNFIIK